jgi:hypothetical protein
MHARAGTLIAMRSLQIADAAAVLRTHVSGGCWRQLAAEVDDAAVRVEALA